MLLAGGLLIGCGATFTSHHKSDAHFDQCHALDLDPQATQARRLFCWQEWLDKYSSGQSRERVQNVERRVLVLRNGDRDQLGSQVTGASERSGFAPLPPDRPNSLSSSKPTRPDTPKDSAGGCQTACSESKEACRDMCDGGCEYCIEEFRDCSERCARLNRGERGKVSGPHSNGSAPQGGHEPAKH